MNSKKWSLNLNDFWKGLIVAILVAVITVLQQMIQANGLAGVNLKTILTVAIVSLLAYLSKNLATSSNGKILNK